ncbi:hypothetical protein AWW67_01300 [Roseivirga seohaensis]|uniref:Nucleotidyltransferase n=1 Tax=Roseivirga seohaensis TaxID=1914963 RepID=A0A150Y198_9BACT|nr:nucleotidyltransferase family protein [Roseivirga seohaensis]KYG84708.1 hypothetical protein AWW67_01300 [Roseivirga seohaensis]
MKKTGLFAECSSELKFFISLIEQQEKKNTDAKMEGINCDDFISFLSRHQVINYMSILMPVFRPNISEADYNKVSRLVEGEVFRQLELTHTLVNIVKLIYKSQINVLSFKGPVLSYELYESYGLKSSIDLDLLVKKEDVVAVEELLLSRGYMPEKLRLGKMPRLVWRLFRIFNYHGGYINLKKRQKIELHWKFFASERAFPKSTEEQFETLKPCVIAGETIFTLPKEDLFIYLAIHGSIHLWVRLKWLLDIRGLLNKYGNDMDWKYVLRESDRVDMRRAILLAVYLSNVFFDTIIPVEMKGQSNDKNLEKLVKRSVRNITGDFSPGSRLKYTQVIMLVKGRPLENLKGYTTLFFYYFTRPLVLGYKKVFN